MDLLRFCVIERANNIQQQKTCRYKNFSCCISSAVLCRILPLSANTLIFQPLAEFKLCHTQMEIKGWLLTLIRNVLNL